MTKIQLVTPDCRQARPVQPAEPPNNPLLYENHVTPKCKVLLLAFLLLSL